MYRALLGRVLLRIWMARQMPKRELKFHHEEIFYEASISINELLIILSSGWNFQLLVITVLVVEVQR